MVLELAYRSVLLNPAMENIAAETEGVVLIDEIEMHLHPAWQWKLLKVLQETFPKVQFIISTHSPIVLSSAKNATLYLMKTPNDVSVLNNVYGYSVNDILTISQKSEQQPKEIEEYYREAERLLDEGDKEDLDNLLKRAREELRDYPAVLKALEDFVKVNLWVEEA
jgi:predicted ATP-binding protein involved in virulence